MTRYTMVIDLERCVGCSACQIACKLENTVGEDSFLSYHEVVTTGKFPQVSYKYIPTMCNHCADAPCVAACPVGALYKRDGLTLHDPERCIGCGACVAACPYGMVTLRDAAGYAAFDATSAIILGGTATGREVAQASGALVPYGNHGAQTALAYAEEHKAQKCCFCIHRVEKGEAPYCAEMCAAGARLWGDADDPESDVAKALAAGAVEVSHPDYGTRPSVSYVGTFGR